MSDSPAAPQPHQAASQDGTRLDSWKSIAAYFNRTVRTVRRWEASEGLPVHRHLHRERGTVFAYTRELDAWQERRGPVRRRRWRLVRWHGRVVTAFVMAGVLLATLVSFAVRQRPAGAAGRDAPVRDAKTPGDALAAVTRAQDLYREGRHYLDRRVGAARARGALEEAVRLAPSDATMHAALGEAYIRLASQTGTSEFWSLAESEIRQALALGPDSAQVHAALGALRAYHDWDLLGGRRSFERALALAPTDADLRSSYASLLRVSGRLAAAIAERTRACAQSPLQPELWSQLGLDYEFARQYDAAIRAYERALVLKPHDARALDGLADAYEGRGWTSRAAAARMRALAVRDRLEDAVQFGERWRRDGYGAAARWLDARNLARAGSGPASHWNRAWMLARLDRRDDAFRELEAALDVREPGLLQLDIDPDFDGLRHDARFQSIARRVSGAVR